MIHNFVLILAVLAIAFVAYFYPGPVSKKFDYRDLTVTISQEGRDTTIKVCNPTSERIAFRDNLDLEWDRNPFGVFVEYNTLLSQETFDTTGILFWYDLRPLYPVISLTSGQCKSIIRDLVSDMLSNDDYAAAKDEPRKNIQRFRVHVLLFEDKYARDYENYVHKDFHGEWHDFKKILGLEDVLDYSFLSVKIEQKEYETTITVCNPTDKIVAVNDTLRLYLPERHEFEPFGLYADIAFKDDTAIYTTDILFFKDGKPFTSYYYFNPETCRKRIENVKESLLEKADGISKNLGKTSSPEKFRIHVLLFEEYYGLDFGKYPHRDFESGWFNFDTLKN